MRWNVLLSRAVGRDPLLFCSADSQALPSNCWMMAGQICLKCSLEIGKWGFRAKISTSWLAEKHTWLDWKEQTDLFDEEKALQIKPHTACMQFAAMLSWFSVQNIIIITVASASPLPSPGLFLQFHGCNHPAEAWALSVNSLWGSASSCREDASLLPILPPADEAAPLSLSKEITASWYSATCKIQPNKLVCFEKIQLYADEIKNRAKEKLIK